jgi:ribonuclease HI
MALRVPEFLTLETGLMRIVCSKSCRRGSTATDTSARLHLSNSIIVSFADKGCGRLSHAVIVTRGGLSAHEHASQVLAASSFDAKLATLESAIGWISTNIDNIDRDDVYLLIDNKAVIRSFLQMHVRSSQTTALRINMLLHDVFRCRPGLKLHLSHCPSHSGVHFNEAVDRLAASRAPGSLIHPGQLRQHQPDDERKRASSQWRLMASSPSYRGRSWLPIKKGRKAFRPRIKDKPACHHFLDMAQNDAPTLARITRLMTNHAPVGEYYHQRRDRFPDMETLCLYCADRGRLVTQTRSHVLTACPKYSNHLPALPRWGIIGERWYRECRLLVNYLQVFVRYG